MPIEIGQRFTRLVVTARAGKDRWAVRCDCGVTKTVYTSSLRTTTKSCGCLKREVDARRHGVVKHGRARNVDGKRHPVYAVWAAMLQRCNNPKSISYERYGGRGITVCERWHVFADFAADMGERPSALHSLDRIDPNGNYEPGNVRWATASEQARTRRLSAERVTALLAKYEREAPDVIARLRKELLG
jgi:hypothetical protein